MKRSARPVTARVNSPICKGPHFSIGEDTMNVIERYAAINYMRPSEVIRMALDRWAKNARYSVELGEGVDTCQDREDPTA